MDTSHLKPEMIDKQGRCKPAYMTDGEIMAELRGETDRRIPLLIEAEAREESRQRARAAAVARYQETRGGIL